MRTVEQWFSEYSESHQNPLNKKIHYVCVPLIVLSLLGLLRALPVPDAFAGSALVNWATLFAALASAYYLYLSPRLALGLIPFAIVMLFILEWMNTWAMPLWQSSLIIFVLSWAGQFYGHHVEGKKPSFFKDIQFLMIGPAWILGAAYRQLGLRY